MRSIDDASRHDIAVALGGPDIYTNREIAELALGVLGKPPKVRGLPGGVLGAAAWLSRPFNGNASSFVCALRASGTMDFVGATCGTHHLRTFFEELAATPL